MVGRSPPTITRPGYVVVEIVDDISMTLTPEMNRIECCPTRLGTAIAVD